MKTVNKFLSLIKFSHTIFAMPFAMIGFCLAAQKLRSQEVVFNANSLIYKFSLVVFCMIFARSAAMAFNRYLDKEFDSQNPRTAVREIPSGQIQPQHALLFTIISSILFITCCFLINNLCFYLSFVALVVVLFYSYTKRFTPLCHLVLGIGLSLAPIGAYLAVTGSFNIVPLLFSFTVLFWVSGFDIIYALQDEEFDKLHQLYSIPAWLGKKNALNVSSVLHTIAALLVLFIGFFTHSGICYWVGTSIFIGMLFYQHSLVKPDDLSKVNIAFMTANGIASVVFALFVIIDILFK